MSGAKATLAALLLVLAVGTGAALARPGDPAVPSTPAPAGVRAEADAALAARDWPAATAALTRLVEHDPTDALACYQLALLLLSYEPSAAQDYLACAAAAPELAAPAGTLQRTLAALAGEPDRAYANTRLALALVGLEAWDMAGLALERALLLKPRYAEAQAYLGLVRAHQGDAAGAALAQAAVTRAPESAPVRYALGRVYALQGDYYAAIPTLIQAAALDPSSAPIAAELGLAYRAYDDYENAARWLRRATELDRSNVRLWEYLAAFYAETGYNLEVEGLTAINSAMLRMPQSASIRASMGWALYNAGELAAARETLEAARALEPSPGSPRTLYYYAVVLEAAGDFAAAQAAYRQVVELAPDTSLAGRAARALGRLGE